MMDSSLAIIGLASYLSTLRLNLTTALHRPQGLCFFRRALASRSIIKRATIIEYLRFGFITLSSEDITTSYSPFSDLLKKGPITSDESRGRALETRVRRLTAVIGQAYNWFIIQAYQWPSTIDLGGGGGLKLNPPPPITFNSLFFKREYNASGEQIKPVQEKTKHRKEQNRVCTMATEMRTVTATKFALK